jgi:hypothetical protein
MAEIASEWGARLASIKRIAEASETAEPSEPGAH